MEPILDFLPGKQLRASYELVDGNTVVSTHTYRTEQDIRGRAAAFFEAVGRTGVGATAQLREARELNRAIVALSNMPWKKDLTDDEVGREKLTVTEVEMLEAVLAKNSILPWRKRLRTWFTLETE